MLFRSFIVFWITHCPPITVTCLYVNEKKCVRNYFLDAITLSIEHPDIESLITKLTKTLDLRYIHEWLYKQMAIWLIQHC